MLFPIMLSLLSLSAHAIASPLKRSTICAADIVRVDPSTASCDSAPAAGECRTADQAAPYIAISYINYGIQSFGEQAALLALMLYESGDFKYAINHYPGVPGQGTRNMQSPAYNLQYAEFLAKVCTNCGITPAEVQSAQAQGPAAVLALVNTDEWSFGSAAWFLVTQCSPTVRQGLSAGTQAGWAAYLACIGTEANEQRNQLWSAAIALGQW
ncbi:hypothetical protein BAUCODRAFT_37420 [Baudoinia panamericana UAMH 10762]|uniref:Transglycosylase SLT domain-containing protein n=1 Tax=Baudoinia panamericana (strain UAMH 10762) TaxID=717646 RepID=M2LHQ7_BAUPA|nr:uncharacterized protein BAUCODRAFT_37420 [Baudoinia panamericana UAMH 10762]EMC93702.1 hypothetical protein BAUCODRAFT_37420 [Baudoinia panamericana UAMH 10762]